MAIKDETGFYNVSEQIRGVYGWSVEDGKIQPPKYDFPPEMEERIQYFQDEMENGLSLYGALRFILAKNDDEEAIKECQFGCAWLPQTEQTQEFLDNSFGLVSSVIAVRLLYPRADDEEEAEIEE